jgi:hypothetical protein
MTEGLLQKLSADLAIGMSDLQRIIDTAPKRYKIYTIPKRSGGTRIIAQPARDLKIIQRYLLDTVLRRLPVHRASMAYVQGRSIAKNAHMHVESDYVLKLDFREFFPSIVVADWERAARKAELKLSSTDLRLCSSLMFWGAGSSQPICLSIGAPSSPTLSNIVMFDIDQELATFASNYGVVYSRYADDITVSGTTTDAILHFEKSARTLISKFKSPRLKFNDEKRGLYGKGQRRMVTGLILTPEEKVSIGRERKRLISAMLHKVALGKADSEHIGKLKGYLGFCVAVEPTFVSSMRSKYGNQLIDRILQSETAKRFRPRLI